jgi:HK97 family phage major capsid protein
MIQPRALNFRARANPVRRSFARLAPGAMLAADDRTIAYVFSDQSVARDGHTIATDGWALDNFRANPVFLWSHRADEPPIGRVTQIGPRGKELCGLVRYAEAEEYPFADTIFRLTKGGFINATSVSWLPLAWNYSKDKSRPGGIDFLEQELLEISAVPVPALPTALATARAAGVDVAPLAAWAERELDLGRSPINFKELEMIRSLASSAPSRIHYARGRAIRTETRSSATVVDLAQRAPFRSFGEFLAAVARSAAEGQADRRLTRAPTGLNETDPTAGGFTVPDAFADDLLGSLYEEAVLAPLCDVRETDKPNNATLPAIDETSRANGSRQGGALAYWLAEGVAPNTTLPKFKALKFNAAKLVALCVATEELISDVPLLDSYMRRAFAAEASFQLDNAILLGSGAGVPLGIVGAPGTIQVAKEKGQAPATIVTENIAKMWSRFPAPCRKRGVWIVNEDVEQQLETLGGSSTPATIGMYFPAGAHGNEFALLKGRPIVVAEQCPALGTVGDIVLADLSQYIILDGGLRSVLSLDVDFLSFQGVFRFVLRVDGRPAWQTPITPYNGTVTRSPFVTLAAR